MQRVPQPDTPQQASDSGNLPTLQSPCYALADALLSFHDICNRHGLSLLHATDIRTVARKPVRRILMCFHKGAPPETVVRDDIILMHEGQRSESYAQLCRDFYL